MAIHIQGNIEVNQQHSQVTKMVVFAKLVNNFNSLNVLVRNFILDVWKGSELVSGLGT